MYVTEYLDGKVEAKYFSAHSNHDLGNAELPHLPLPKGVKEEITIKLSLEILPERIMEGKYNNYWWWGVFGWYTVEPIIILLSSKLNRHTSGCWSLFQMGHIWSVHLMQALHHQTRYPCQMLSSDMTCLSLLVSELQQEAFDPILLFKPQGEKSTTHYFAKSTATRFFVLMPLTAPVLIIFNS